MRDIPRIILLIPEYVSYGRGLLRGIARYSRLHGPWAFYSERGNPNRVISLLKNWNASGIITYIPQGKAPENVIPANMPAVVLASDCEIPGYPNIIGDWNTDGKVAAEYFLNRGFRHFAYCSYANLDWPKIRGQAFENRLKKEGHDVHFYEQPYLSLHRHWEKEQEHLAAWLESLPKPIAVMACNDERGKHVLEACKIADLCIPEQVAVLGVDNDETICELTGPPLSSVAVNTERGGYEAAELLDKMIKNPGKNWANKDNVIVQTMQIETRQSTDVLAIEDESVAKALRYIRMNAKKVLQVDDVANDAAVSRRGLERRFKKFLGRSIHEEIRRVRIEEICKLLLETNLSVSQISYSLGFPEIPHMSRFFTRETGMSPIEYRRTHLGQLQSQ